MVFYNEAFFSRFMRPLRFTIEPRNSRTMNSQGVPYSFLLRVNQFFSALFKNKKLSLPFSFFSLFFTNFLYFIFLLICVMLFFYCSFSHGVCAKKPNFIGGTIFFQNWFLYSVQNYFIFKNVKN